MPYFRSTEKSKSSNRLAILTVVTRPTSCRMMLSSFSVATIGLETNLECFEIIFISLKWSQPVLNLTFVDFPPNFRRKYATHNYFFYLHMQAARIRFKFLRAVRSARNFDLTFVWCMAHSFNQKFDGCVRSRETETKRYCMRVRYITNVIVLVNISQFKKPTSWAE